MGPILFSLRQRAHVQTACLHSASRPPCGQSPGWEFLGSFQTTLGYEPQTPHGNFKSWLEGLIIFLTVETGNFHSVEEFYEKRRSDYVQGKFVLPLPEGCCGMTLGSKEAWRTVWIRVPCPHDFTFYVQIKIYLWGGMQFLSKPLVLNLFLSFN